jgi:hypothetical protein
MILSNLPYVDKQFEQAPYSGLCGLLYISAWMCSMIGLRRLQATGSSRFGKAIILINLYTLSIANLYNVYEAIEPKADTSLFWILDAFWPISNILMLIIGITVVRANRLKGWKRFSPLLCGLWLPLTIIGVNLFGKTPEVMLISGMYSAFTWMLMAYMVSTTSKQTLTAKQVWA